MKILCTLPNASDVINGVRFVEHKLGMLSEEVAEEVGKLFASIPGYKVHDPDGDLTKLRARATELGVADAKKKGAAVLADDIAAAEAAAAEKQKAADAAAQGQGGAGAAAQT